MSLVCAGAFLQPTEASPLAVQSKATTHQQITPYDDDGGNSAIDDYLNVNLGATSPNASSIAFQVAKLGSDTLLDLELSALQQESKAEIISSPRLITTNKKPAYIEQGTEIPYLESSSSGATSVAFKKAVLSLEGDTADHARQSLGIGFERDSR